MVLIVSFLIYLASYLLTIPEIKFGEVKLLLVVVFRVSIYMFPPLFNGDANAVC